jgi:hypothetical protein
MAALQRASSAQQTVDFFSIKQQARQGRMSGAKSAATGETARRFSYPKSGGCHAQWALIRPSDSVSV